MFIFSFLKAIYTQFSLGNFPLKAHSGDPGDSKNGFQWEILLKWALCIFSQSCVTSHSGEQYEEG